MKFIDPFIFGALVFGGGASMMALHWDKIFRLKFKELSDDENRFYRGQYLRRMITSGMITLIGILFMVYRFLPTKSLTKVWLIAAVLLLVGTVLIMALIDFSSLRKLYQIQGLQAARATRDLADELHRLQKEAKAKKKPSEESEEKPDSRDKPEPDSPA